MRKLSKARVAVLVVGTGGLALAVVLAVSMARGIGKQPIGDVEAGIASAALFQLPSLGASEGIVDLADYQDRPLLLYFWASYCVPCRTEAPMIQRLWPEYERRGYAFIGVNILDSEREAQKFVRDYELTFPLAFDAEGAAYLQYGVYGIPETFFVDRGLQVTDKYLGELTEELLRERLDRLSAGQVGGGG